MTKVTNNSCAHATDLLAYLYDELSPAGRDRLDSHLGDCDDCINEFAELSEARYSVFEWKNLEFAPLATPKIVLPNRTSPTERHWLDVLKAAFAWNRGWIFAGGAMSVLLVLVTGVVLFDLGLKKGDDRAEVTVSPIASPSAAREEIDRPSPVPAAAASSTESKKTEAASEINRKLGDTSRPALRNAPSAKRVRLTSPAADQGRRITSAQKPPSSPTLGQYAEYTDESLRLTDIFDDLDNRDME